MSLNTPEDVLIDWKLVKDGQQVDKGVMSAPDFEFWVYQHPGSSNAEFLKALRKQATKWRYEFPSDRRPGKFAVSVRDMRLKATQIGRSR